METATKQFEAKGWEYYLALAMIVIAGVSTLLMALHVLGVL
jgi:hypothetical protein